MSDVIRLLPDSVANQIAAGEVIQRPASVIKELIENSVDAGATEIKIFIKDAGRTLIQVVDNGKGMSETDARMAFERHATSKIKMAGDLFNLHTMGFRGEALPSICAVSNVELKTRTIDSSMGTRLVINASKFESQEPSLCDVGTNIMVKNLFFNVPARRKFLKSDSVEMSNILREFERLALVNHGIRLTIDYGNKVLDLRRATFKQRIADIWKNSIDQQLLPLEVKTSLVNISGFVTRPEYARRRNPLQYMIVNGRNMRHPYFHKAIASCYENLIATDTQPCYFLKFEVDPASIDVNIHPTKNEIKFEYEQEIWPIIQASVKAALGQFGAVPSIDFTMDVLPVKPIKKGEDPIAPKVNLRPDYSPFDSIPGKSFKESFSKGNKNDKIGTKDWETLYSNFMNSSRDHGNDINISKEIKPEPSLPGTEKTETVEDLCIQHASRYIITSSNNQLLVIDQRKAHVRILYEDFLHHLRNGKVVSQGLMFPDFLKLEESQISILNSVLPELTKIGFKIVSEDDRIWKIISVPAILKKIDYPDLILGIIDSVSDDSINYGKSPDLHDRLIEDIALVMARKSAIPSIGKLTSDEMEHIISKLFSLPAPSISPDGSKIYITIDSEKLDKYFSM